MSLPTVTAQLGLPDPTAKPLTVTDLVTLLNQLFLPVSIGNYSAQIVVSSGTPGVGDQDKLWFKKDTSGRPFGLYSFFSGNWRPLYTGKSNEVTLYTGFPGHDFDNTGLGLIGNVWDGWALMNGQNGTTDISDKFIVSAHMNQSGGINQYNGGWQTTVTGNTLHTGGSKDVTLNSLNTYRAASNAIIVGLFSADGNAPNSSGGMYGGVHVGIDTVMLEAADPGNPTPDPVPTVPPFYSLAYAQFVGY